MRTLGIDFGERRIGLALSDPEGCMAFPLTTLIRRSDQEVIGQIKRIIDSESVEGLVMGEPLTLDGQRGSAAERVCRFAEKLSLATGLTCRLVNESLTSVEAERQLREQGIDLGRDPGRIDALAAKILLQEVLDEEESA